jgi:type I restriction enzyme, S subunit
MNKISITTLGSLIEFQRGYDLPKSNFAEGNIPVISSNGILGYHNKYKVKGPGITIGRSGTVGLPHYIEENFYPHNTSLYIKDFKGNNPKYIYYLLKTLGLNDRGSGSGVPTMNRNHLHPLKVSAYLDIHTQQQIASVLSTLDSKIALNNRINAELEAMAKMLYDYWFVQFDFPNAEGKPYKSNGGEMVWNEELKREVPEGWDSGELQDIANIKMGQSPPGETYNSDGDGMIFYQGCTDFGNRFPTVRQYTTQPTRFAKEGDILLSVRAPVGTLNIAKEDCCIGRGLAALNSKVNCIAYLFGIMVNLKQIFDRRNVDGTTFGSITKDDLFSLKVVKPDNDILKQYHNIINPAFEKQNKIALENIQLSSLRDWLLPMLMNGQVKVDDVDEEWSGLMVAEPREKYGE